MDYDEDKVDEITLALLWLTSFKDPVGVRAWKGQDWDTMERLHLKGFISDPKSKAKSVVLSEEGERRSRELFAKHFKLEHQVRSLDRQSMAAPRPKTQLRKSRPPPNPNRALDRIVRKISIQRVPFMDLLRLSITPLDTLAESSLLHRGDGTRARA